ncbi:MAG: von Willebrand factor type A domain-containing protein, partial [Oscillospiraceae bacterium]|nr:von Willebrand factor type A domain-containing protein [Oscillospiraceae bacterium]
MKRSMKLTAALLACAMAVLPASSGIGAFAAENSTAKTTAAEKKDDKAAKKEKLAHSPLDASDKKAVKAFEESKPKLTENNYRSYYYSMISWEPVENALLYYVYIKKPGDVKYSFFAKTYDTSVYLSDYASYKVRAVTFTTDDKKVTGKLSDEFVFEKPKPKETTTAYYDDDDLDGVYYEEEEYEEEIEEEYEAEEEYYEEEDYDPPEIAYTTSAVNKNAVPDVSNEEYAHYEESDFKDVTKSPLSTFSADADTASYTNFRRYAANNHLSSLSQDAVRIEEWLNYFDYDYPAPTGKNLFSVTSEVAECPWNDEALVMMIGVRAKDIAEEPRSNYVFLVDVSGSMDEPDKLPLVKQSINALTGSLTDKDTISIVTYSGAEATVLCGAKGNAVNTVKEMTECMNAWGSTNGEGGIKEAYRIAENLFIEGGNNRIIMASDGDLNVGIYDTNELTKLVEDKRESGVYLTVLGFGEGNLKDEKMSALADNGNGSYHYIDCAEEAEKVLVEEGHQTLYTVAKDVKFQVEFNPETVSGYRLIGYDKRALKNEDFDNDKVDAAEVGANQTVTVLYELIPAKTKSGSLKYQKSTGNKTEFCTFRINCKNP